MLLLAFCALFSVLGARFLKAGVRWVPMEKWEDEIVAEIRAVREAYARRFNYDVGAICEDLQRRQTEGNRKVVRLPPEQLAAEGRSTK